MANGAFSQGGKYEVVLIGQITNNQNGGPINDQEVNIYADSLYTMDFSYHKTVYTDEKGFFYDTLKTDLKKGAFIVTTQDYLDIDYDTTVYFRFNWNPTNTLFANFKLPLPDPVLGHQANFEFIENPFNTNALEFQFTDITNSTNVVFREWDFGDENGSNEISPLHTYSEPGVYRVSLYVVILGSEGNTLFESYIEKIINVKYDYYFHLGGTVYAGYFPIDTGIVYLYKVNGQDIVPIDTAIFNEQYGHYYFYQLLEGEYFVKADIPASSNAYGTFFPTYYSDEFFWTEADTIFHNITNFDYDIDLIPIPQVTNGQGLINGNISFDPFGEKDPSPACYAELLLLNDNDEPISVIHSDENGDFSFLDVELTSFKVFAEVTGKYTNAINVTLDQNNPVIENIEIIIASHTVNGGLNGISDLEWNSSFSEVYPNPVSEMASIKIDLHETTDISIEIYNNTGQLIKQSYKTAYSGETTVFIKMDSQPSGFYFLHISGENQQLTKKFIKK
ncbi:MAG: hypothetical protein DRJ05_01295 [Bacteroidetes bacterium]|nr:MAG: hypothetical protein DRJ05_01295 [Bacteroidota bacterium]